MAMIKQTVVVLVALSAVWIPVSDSAKTDKPVIVARKDDIPYIKCQVCEKVASQLYLQVKKKQDQISPQKISEYQVIEIAEKVCNLKKEEADWIMKLDIMEQGDKLEVMDYVDTDIAEYIFTTKPQIDLLVKHLCKDLTNSCSKKPPPVPKNRMPGEPFVPKPSKEAEMEKIMRSMEGMPGAPGMKMYSREELMGMNNFGNEDAEDEDDEDEQFPSNMGKVLREKQNTKDEWKQKIFKGIKGTGEALKGHANSVSNQIQKWWKGVRAAPAKKNSKTGKSEL
uniref:Saposin B-type domain-containing protein n=2 Tax=Salix viminalis TaxID=40686 RepID=A0A6N2NJ28_SALVM